MVQRYHIEFLELNADLISGRVLVVGSKQYDYDPTDLAAELRRLGAAEVVGIDIADGPGVDAVVDITDASAPFLAEHAAGFDTVFCMEVLTNVVAPYRAAEHVQRLVRPGGGVFLGECVVRKLSRMPLDYWRFTPDGLTALFAAVDIDPDRTRLARTRDKEGRLDRHTGDLPEIAHTRHPDETAVGHLVRRVHRKLLAGGDFRLSRSFPELTVLLAGTRSDRTQLLP